MSYAPKFQDDAAVSKIYDNRRTGRTKIQSGVAQRAYDWGMSLFHEPIDGLSIIAEYEPMAGDRIVHVSVETDLICIQQRVYNEDGLQHKAGILDALDLTDHEIPIIDANDDRDHETVVCLSVKYFPDPGSSVPLEKLHCKSMYCAQEYVDSLLDEFSPL